MSNIIKLEALRGIGSLIERTIPELRTKVQIVQVPPDEKLKFPCLAVVPAGSPRFSFSYQSEHSRPTATSMVACVGAWEASVQLRLAHATPHGRYDLQQRIEEMFFQREDAPGILLTTITACDQYGDFLASWEMRDGGWEDEFAFSAQSWAVTTLGVVIPALVKRNSVFMFNDLRLGLTHDFTIPQTSTGFDEIPGRVTVNDDGTVTPVGGS